MLTDPAGLAVRLVHTHSRKKSKKGYFLRPTEDVTVGSPSVFWASGALVSNADDLARFLRALLGGRLVPPELLQAMKTTIQGVPEFAYGLGLEKMRGPCGQLWGHTVGTPATRSTRTTTSTAGGSSSFSSTARRC